MGGRRRSTRRARLGAGVLPGRGAVRLGRGYVNFLTEDEAARVPDAYGANYARLVAAKQRFDPGNVFRMNLNIAP